MLPGHETVSRAAAGRGVGVRPARGRCGTGRRGRSSAVPWWGGRRESWPFALPGSRGRLRVLGRGVRRQGSRRLGSRSGSRITIAGSGSGVIRTSPGNPAARSWPPTTTMAPVAARTHTAARITGPLRRCRRRCAGSSAVRDDSVAASRWLPSSRARFAPAFFRRVDPRPFAASLRRGRKARPVETAARVHDGGAGLLQPRAHAGLDHPAAQGERREGRRHQVEQPPGRDMTVASLDADLAAADVAGQPPAQHRGQRSLPGVHHRRQVRAVRAADLGEHHGGGRVLKVVAGPAEPRGGLPGGHAEHRAGLAGAEVVPEGQLQHLAFLPAQLDQ